MARYLCQLCYNVVNYGENHPCSYYKNDDEVYSLPYEIHDAKDKSTKNSNNDSGNLVQSVDQNIRKKSDLVKVSVFQNNGKDKFLPSRLNRRTSSARCSNDEQKRNPCDISYFNPISDLQMTEVQFQVDVSFTASSKNVDSWYRPENDFREANNISPIVVESTGVEETTQRGSGIPDLVPAIGREEGEMPRQENKWRTLNKEKMNLMDFPESMIRTDISDNRDIIGLRNVLVNPDIIPENHEPEESKMHVSENVCDGHNSIEMHSQFHCKNEKISTTLQEHISSKAETDPVAGPSGVSHLKKKLPAIFSKNNTIHTHHRTHTGQKTFVCNICNKQFSRKYDRNRHYRIHTGEKPYECDKCGKFFSQKSNLIEHHRTHTGEKPFECNVCKSAFAQQSTLNTHMRTHKPYKCPVCGKDFMTSSYYSFHMTFHK